MGVPSEDLERLVRRSVLLTEIIVGVANTLDNRRHAAQGMDPLAIQLRTALVKVLEDTR